MNRTLHRNVPSTLTGLPLLMIGAALLLADPAHAQSTCVSPAYGVPGLPGAPQWASGSPIKTDIDDPRWAGASRIYFPQDLGSGGLAESNVRLIRQGNILSVSFRMKADPNSDSADTFWLGVGKGASEADDSTADNDYFLVRVTMNAVTAGADAEAATDVEVWETGDPSAGWSAALSHTWLSDVSLWDDPATDIEWAINLKVDLGTTGIGATGSEGRLFLGSFAEVNISDAWVSFWPPGSVSIVDSETNLTESMIDPTNWATMTYGSYSAPCNDGISLTAMQIGAAPAPDNLINTPTGSDTTANDYFAKPDWAGHSYATEDVVNATFRIANWGTTVSDRPNAPWTTIATVGNDTSGEFHHACPVGTAVCGTIDTTTKDDHQCMLVTLQSGSATPADPLKFARDSVYRNMDFDVASKLERFATVSVQGLQPLAGSTHRDVFLLVKTANMPAPSNEPYFLPLDAMKRATALAQRPPHIPPAKRAEDPKKNEAKAATTKAVKALASTAPQVEAPPFPLDPDLAHDGFEALNSVWPTYEVHAFHDTGRTVTLRGKKYRLIEPQIAFGYFVSHQGQLYGFQHALEGAEGVVVTQLAPDYYKLSVPNNGSVKIKSTIEAVETKGGCDCKNCCQPPPVQVHINPRCYCTLPGARQPNSHWAWLALAAIGLPLWRRSRRNPRAF